MAEAIDLDDDIDGLPRSPASVTGSILSGDSGWHLEQKDETGSLLSGGSEWHLEQEGWFQPEAAGSSGEQVHPPREHARSAHASMLARLCCKRCFCIHRRNAG